MKFHPPVQSCLAAAALLALSAAPAIAGDLDIPDGKLVVSGAAGVGTVIRTEARDPELIVAPNAAVVGVVGAAVASKNGDDGNLNYGNGATVSKAVKGTVSLAFRRGNIGFAAGAKAWDDFALKDDDVPFGNNPNNYVPNTPLSDAGFTHDARFSGADFTHAYVFGHTQLGKSPLDWKAGLQVIDWGHSALTIGGGLRDLTARDFAAATRAGATQEEILLPVPALSATLALSPATRIDAFWETAFRANVAPGCGTFFAANDYTAPGCDRAMLGAASDATSLAKGQFIGRAPDQTPSGAGEFGIYAHHYYAPIATEVGAYAAQFDSRAPFLGSIKSLRAAGTTPYIALNPGGLNPQYFMTNPADIRMFGLTFDKKLARGAVNGELSYRPNQPMQYNAVDVLNAFASLVAPTPLRAAATAVAAGGTFDDFERHAQMQLNVGGHFDLPNILGSHGGTVGGEITFKHVIDMPNILVTRFGRSDIFGQAPVGGAACAAGTSAKTCSLAGYVSADSSAYRLRVALNYPQLFNGVDFTPSLGFGQDVHGWSSDGTINEGREAADLKLTAVIHKAWTAQLSWVPTWGGAYNPLKDRSFATASLGYRF